MFTVCIHWGGPSTRGETEPCEYEFATQAERDAFMLGVREAMGWTEFEVVQSEPDALYTYEELSDEAKKRARADYIAGWLETHPEEKDEADDEWADEMLSDDDDDYHLYDKDGVFASDQ